MDIKLKEIMILGAQEFGCDLTNEQVDKFDIYRERLKEKNKVMNLTAIDDDTDVVIKHFIDSISILPFINGENIKLLDIGTGAGFPGLPIKIIRSDVDVTLVDSVNKKVNFINELISELCLNDVCAIHSRAEDLGVLEEHRESYDIVTARAVSTLSVLCEYCIPFLKVGGIFLAMKGGNLQETESCEDAIKILGGEIEEIREFNLPFTDNHRKIIVIKKFRQTPSRYPRKSGKARKNPL
ncbi:MAG TPA: 16S rRNA (guanine(527)-N(7))-methyltransferase RsmG [Clostridia bacterium]|nr:16S rRNA (guanine(527)-N(7))-methyltransferase RsmG [Clostridia bacterium]